MKDSNRKVTVRLNQQQRELLEQLRQEGTFGDSMDEIVLNLFRAHVEQSREAKE